MGRRIATARGLGSALRRRWAALPADRRLAGWLGLVLLGLAIYLVSADPPWQTGIAEARLRGYDPRPRDYAATWSWWAALANAGVLAGLLATRRLWFDRAPAPEVPSLASPARRPRWLPALVWAAALAVALLAWPRLDQSLWDDEEYALRRAVHGTYEREPDGSLEFEELRWRDAFFEYRKPTNHVPYTILARISLKAWEEIAAPEVRLADERAYRLPAWLAGSAAVALAGLFVARLGHPAAGACTAWLLALHPWVQRYASEARGYALVLLLVPAALWLGVRALHRGTWGRWLGGGAVQLLLLWTFPGALWFLVVLNAALVVALLRLHRGADRTRQLARWAVASLAAAMAFLQLMLPNLMQFAQMVEERFAGGLAGDFGPRALAYLLAGMPWRTYDSLPLHPELADVASDEPGIFAATLLVGLLALGAGAVRLAAAGPARALLLAVLVLPAPLAVATAWLQDLQIYVWYLVFALPGLAMLVALGLEGVGSGLRGGWRAGVVAGAMALYLALFARVGQPARHALLERSLQPLRESVEHTRPTLDPFAPENREILTVAIYAPADYYDPRVRAVRTEAELREWMREADRSGRALYVNFGRLHVAQSRREPLVELVEREHLFTPTATLHGFEPKMSRYVYRYRGRETEAETP